LWARTSYQQRRDARRRGVDAETLIPETQQDAAAVPCGCVVIDKELLLNAVHAHNAAGKPARADTLSIELGAIADDGGYWDVITVADDLAELESLGKSNALLLSRGEGIGPAA